ncbi:MAG: PEGA domain-containing protein [Acidobacteriaceae bacterium]|nr:PEGA domain-containing protein [Acidobacteriaceae bacterium]
MRRSGSETVTSVADSGATLRRSTTTAVASGPAAFKNGPAPPSNEKSYDRPAITRRRHETPEDAEPRQAQEKSSFGKRLGLILAMCFAIAAAIVFIVKWNSGPAVPVQVIDPSSGPVTPPPPQTSDTSAPQRRHKPDNPVRRTQMAAGENRAPQTPATSRGGVGDIELLSDPPGAKLLIDGRSDASCNAPCTLSLPVGRHTLTAELNGYGISRRIFTVPNDDSLLIPLNKSMGVLLVTSKPSGCTVVVDGREYGQTPQTLHLPTGTHHVSVFGGSRQHQEAVEIPSDGFEVRSFPCQ